MSPASRAPGLFQRLLARPAPTFDDAADLGTCFGLEVSLDQQDEAPQPAAEPPRSASWVRRLTSRGRGTE